MVDARKDKVETKETKADSKGEVPDIVIDASGLVLGRLASYVAKEALNGRKVVILNSEKVFVTGSKDSILEEFLHKVHVGSSRKGPYYSRMPDKIVKRTIRGMVKFTKYKGREAYKRVMAYIGVPKTFENVKLHELPKAKARPGAKGMTVGEIAKHLGAHYE